MTAFDIMIIAAVPIGLLAIWFGIFVHRIGWSNMRKELKSRMDQSEWYDEEGNHVYYDRKIIRYQQRRKSKTSVSDNE